MLSGMALGGLHDLEKIAPTAEFTAAVWAELGLENAEHFVTPRGARLLRAYSRAAEPLLRRVGDGPSLVEYLEYRHRAIDQELEAIGPDRILECAAGLSRRGLTFAKRGVPVLELDLPHMVEAKRRRLAELDVPTHLRVEACDLLTDEFEAKARAFFAGAERPAIVAEGFMSYLPLGVRGSFIGRVADALRPTGGAFVGDFRLAPQSVRARAVQLGFRLLNRAVTSGRGLREDFPSLAMLATYLEASGFDRIEPVAPRDVVGERGELPHPGLVLAAFVDR